MSVQSPRSVQMTYQETTIQANVTAQFGAIKFLASSFPAFADWAAAMDAYRLRKVRVLFQPKVNQHNLTTKAVATTTSPSVLLTALDYDDATALSTLSSIESYQSLKIHPLFDQASRNVVPKLARAAYSGGVFNGFTQDDSDVWVDAASNNVEYYGIKWATTATGGSQTTFPEWYVWVTGWFEFRQPR